MYVENAVEFETSVVQERLTYGYAHDLVLVRKEKKVKESKASSVFDFLRHLVCDAQIDHVCSEWLILGWCLHIGVLTLHIIHEGSNLVKACLSTVGPVGLTRSQFVVVYVAIYLPAAVHAIDTSSTDTCNTRTVH